MAEEQIKYGRYVWSVPLDGNIDTIGRYLGKFSQAGRPTPALEGQEYLNQDTLTFFKYNGEAWVEMSGSFVGEYEEFPDIDAIGKEIYRTDLNAFFKWNGVEWVEVGRVGTGGGLEIIRREDSFPSGPPTGTVVYREDLDHFFVYSAPEDEWTMLSAMEVYLGSYDGEFPSSPLEGQEVYRSDLGEYYKYNGEYWLEI